MANDFSGDTNCVALYRWEAGEVPFLADSKSTNTLTKSNTPAETETCKEGTGAADFERGDNDAFYIADASLSADFPLKNGATNPQFSVCMWLRWESFSSGQYIVSKAGTNTYTFRIAQSDADAKNILVSIGIDGGTDWENLGTTTLAGATTGLATGKWYHLGFTFNDATKAWYVKLWDDSESEGYENSGTATNNINIEAGPLYIGKEGNGSAASFDGIMDEQVWFKDILTEDEIDQIRDQTYGASAGGTYFMVIK